MKFLISVIIPVYNGEGFIEKAILSAVEHSEVIEVITVNDGSTDNTDNVLKKLNKLQPKLKVYYHDRQHNKGRSASRNLGIKEATGNFIAFLDADDYYLSNRFVNDKIILEENLKIDGVYNAIGVHFYRKASKEEQDRLRLTTLSKKIEPKNLFKMLFEGKYGHFSIDGLTVKRTIFDSIGYFNESLEVGEDTEIIFRMALKCRLKSGILNSAVAIRGVHDVNIFNNKEVYKENRTKMYESILFWSSKNQISSDIIDELLKIIWLYRFKEKKGIIKDIFYWGHLFIYDPRILFSKFSVKYFPIVRLRQRLFPFLFKQ